MGSRLNNFTPEQDKFIIHLHKRFTVHFFAARLGVSPAAIEIRMVELGLRPKHQPQPETTRIILSHIIKPLPEKQEYYLRGKIAESVILSLA